MRCPHCEKPIKPTQNTFEYPKSRVIAHLDCVSLKSYARTDILLAAQQAAKATERTNPTRRVYSTDTGFADNTRTGRVPARAR